MADLYYPDSLKDALNTSQEDNAAVAAVKFDIINRENAETASFDKSIYLYMPESLANPTNVTWDSQGVGIGGQSLIDEGSIVDAGNAIKVVSQKASDITNAMRGKLSGGAGEASAETITSIKDKKALNPYLKMAFRNVNFRNFEFLFKFTPHNKAESKRIYEIIQTFRKAAHPSVGGNGKNSYRVDYPNEIQIEYQYQGDVNPWLNKFKRCVITDMSVNYTGAGFFAQMRDGFPVQTELRLQFSEIELLYAEDIETSGVSY